MIIVISPARLASIICLEKYLTRLLNESELTQMFHQVCNASFTPATLFTDVRQRLFQNCIAYIYYLLHNTILLKNDMTKSAEFFVKY